MNGIGLEHQLEDPLAFAREKGLIRKTPPKCTTCQEPMRHVRDVARKLDGYTWRCPRHKGHKMSIRAESWSVYLALALRICLSSGFKHST